MLDLRVREANDVYNENRNLLIRAGEWKIRGAVLCILVIVIHLAYLLTIPGVFWQCVLGSIFAATIAVALLVAVTLSFRLRGCPLPEFGPLLGNLSEGVLNAARFSLMHQLVLRDGPAGNYDYARVWMVAFTYGWIMMPRPLLGPPPPATAAISILVIAFIAIRVAQEIVLTYRLVRYCDVDLAPANETAAVVK